MPSDYQLTYLASGFSRHVFLSRSGKNVVKVPANYKGVEDNHREARLWSRWKRGPDTNGIRYAKCRIVPGTDVLIMELVEETTGDNRPRWADYVDSGQVGRNQRGEIVAYDPVY